MRVTCQVCLHDDRDALEALGRRALTDPTYSWRQASRDTSVPHMSLKNHMERHFVADHEAQAQEALTEDVADTLRNLRRNAALAPTEVQPLYFVAIRNLEGLMDTKPSQQHLLAAIKAIHEVTGMRNEQRILLAFAAEHFGGTLEEAEDVMPAALLVTTGEEVGG